MLPGAAEDGSDLRMVIRAPSSRRVSSRMLAACTISTRRSSSVRSMGRLFSDLDFEGTELKYSQQYRHCDQRNAEDKNSLYKHRVGQGGCQAGIDRVAGAKLQVRNQAIETMQHIPQ